MPQTPRPLAVALAATLVAALAVGDADAARKRSSSKKAVVPAVTACGDYYTFVHKAWLDSNLFVGGSGSISAMSQLQERALQQQI